MSAGSTTIVLDQPDKESGAELILLSPTEEARNAGNRVISEIINVELVNNNGDVIQPNGKVEICFTVDNKENGACLSFYDEVKKKWICEDPCLRYSDGRACGKTNHFTNFAVILSGSGSSSGCGDTNEDWILASGWQDAILLASTISCSLCIVNVIILASTLLQKRSKKTQGEARIIIHEE